MIRTKYFKCWYCGEVQHAKALEKQKKSIERAIKRREDGC